ncbi:hypothetical protein [Flavihumibacter fluvii]|jgi:hypothetical protein|uniref:hypothetical protein n=1 Tax=Flavihumibacter fluvii TaxID=2838157 RepID=UPI001BDEB22C|nr:hypothetical protein [Flavihumibacter fluvii]ULQ53561.1 hypothetical protein KJS93_04405 [Flavihumibacter fluvii]
MKFIAVADNKKNIRAIADQLRSMGCSIHQVMKITGVITGDSGQLSLADIKIKGIRSVEEDRTITL